ncbi:N-acyl-D-amino-acid deacylase family protein [Sphingomonas prati]|uniref:N-acyl-D-aspartate/D-glutamate deacylase n=1 Tax=Sphingomonas prati TaxID=1843237 RepID=A0A7W9BR79_9SPHN|nr:amidohydrolase family protein [Sphingomonas prati]MBB5728654.1 N-acyl-D-aspartate/D-glutamate deacylase [Sphingomonas prati]GGE72119.1 aminoacylase [Sphingomonas prati]
MNALLLTALALAAPTAPQVDVVIRGGTLYSGADAAPITGDVEISGDRIVYVGPTRRTAAARVIDAKGQIVAPGFIDAHTHPDTYIRSPDAKQRLNLPWLAQGVATIVMGVDGGGTPDVAQDARTLTAAGVGTNLVPFVGFGAIRGRVLGQDDRAPTAPELAQEKALAAKAMCEGATGLSTGLFYAPQSYAKTDEVIAVAREAGSRGGMYDTHQRDESNYTIGLIGSTKEAIEIGRQAKMPVHFAHLKALGVDLQGQAPQLIATIAAARAAGQDVTADQYPWLASGSSVDASLLPRWASDGGYRKLIARFDDPATLARIKVEMVENLRRRGGKESILLTSEGMPWTGRTLGQMATAWNTDPIDAAIRIMRVANKDGTEPAGVGVASFNMADRDVDLLMQQPWIVTSSDGSDGHPRQYATFPRKYQTYVRERKVITLRDFIRRSTGLTADMYRIEHRGYLRAGYYADVVVFDPTGYAPRADYVHPRVPSVGVKALFVNGKLALQDGATTGTAAGRVLLRPTPANCPAP